MTKLEEIAYAMGLLEDRDGKTWNCGGHDFGTRIYEFYWEDQTPDSMEAILIENNLNKGTEVITEKNIDYLMERLETLNISLDRTKVPKPERKFKVIVFSYTDDLTCLDSVDEEEYKWRCIKNKTSYPVIATIYGTSYQEAFEIARKFEKYMQKSCIVNNN